MQIYFEIIFAAPLSASHAGNLPPTVSPVLPLFQWHFRHPSLTKWCKDRDIPPLLPSPRQQLSGNKNFQPAGPCDKGLAGFVISLPIMIRASEFSDPQEVKRVMEADNSGSR